MESKKTKLIITIVVIISILLITILINVITFESKKKKVKDIPLESCLKVGNECSSKEIKKGIKVGLKVSSNNYKSFYVLNNDKENVTLILDKNITESSWANDTNINGPINAIDRLATTTKKWNRIDTIYTYSYSDYGFISLLKNSDKLDSGYFLINITDGEMEIQSNSFAQNRDNKTTKDYKLKTRLVTYEEIKELQSNNILPEWLIEDKDNGFWTLSSSTEKGSNKTAYSVINNNKKIQLKSNSVNTKLGIRPVVTIKKELL